MIVPASEVTKICNHNVNRCYIAFQNIDAITTNCIYLLPEKKSKEEFLQNGICIGGGGFFEMQNCNSQKSKTDWYAYTAVAAGIDLRIADI